MQYICQFGSVCVCARAIMQTPVGRTIKMLIFIYHKRSICSHNINIFVFLFLKMCVKVMNMGIKKNKKYEKQKKSNLFQLINPRYTSYEAGR